jgi:hypothetical protein
MSRCFGLGLGGEHLLLHITNLTLVVLVGTLHQLTTTNTLVKWITYTH